MLRLTTFAKFSNSIKLLAVSTNQISCLKHTLPDLPYDYGALEPIISAEIMRLHHQKHHAAYVNNLNIAEEKLAEAQAKNDISAMIALEPALRFNGGGHINHSIFWKNLSPNGGEPGGDLLNAIKQSFGSLDEMKAQMSAAAVGVQGSGWAWLGCDPKTHFLQITTCANQDPLKATKDPKVDMSYMPPPYPQMPPPIFTSPPQAFVSPPTPIVSQPETENSKTTVILMKESKIHVGKYPIKFTCPNCKQDGITFVQMENGRFAYLATVLTCLVFFPLFFVPLCIDWTKDVIHTCPFCHVVIGVKKRF